MTTTLMTDAPVTTTAKRPAEFDARVMAYLPGLKNLAWRWTKSKEQHEDLVNETIATALFRWENFREDGGMWMWLLWTMRGIVKNDASRAINRKKVATLCSLDESRGIPVTATQEYEAELSQVVAQLASTRHGVTLLRRAIGEEGTVIAKEMGISKERVRQLQMQARAEVSHLAA